MPAFPNTGASLHTCIAAVRCVNSDYLAARFRAGCGGVFLP